MTSKSLFKKEQLLFIVLAGFFVCNALVAEFIGVKLFSVEGVLGMDPVNFTILGNEGLSFNMTAGVLLWPVVFIMTDIINEYFGKRGVRILSWLTAGLIIFAFVVIYLSIQLEPADFWHFKELDQPGEWPMKMDPNSATPPPGKAWLNMQTAFAQVFGQGLWIIVGSLTAFLVGQFIDVYIFQWLKKLTGEKKIWLRATGSTLVSQLIDSFVVLIIAFYIGGNYELKFVLALGVMSYLYKFVVAVAVTPVLYLIHWLIDLYLGKDLSQNLRNLASDS